MASNTPSAKTLAEQEAGRNALARTGAIADLELRADSLMRRYRHFQLDVHHDFRGTDRLKWMVTVEIVRLHSTRSAPEHIKTIPGGTSLFKETVPIDAFPSNELVAYLALFED